ncbi:AAA family ATPase [Frigoribacterium sp. NBH87]|uniref:AAA family ATPase n=1 Tax=Frigoribacterium sp. NBH87 TaxID=2596916 RepID=UPI001629AF83|nr:AAA family ATPase [Frigoribacterium sp. NBH87]QNE44278.1 AAA family ATPase [Frigoribacterium sp. NBH87]
MILHRLTLRALGPYAGEHSIDFAALGASGTFLLEGPTGAGKSTVIDAIVFALYGQLAGEGASRDRLRSHHAAAHVEPFAELVFETAAGVHRIRRSPAWQRPKSRGTGTTPANATATLVRLTSPDAVDGEVVSTSTQEVGHEIGRVLGLTRQQFVQTVVLPQGEFAAFLRSSGEDRRRMLQSLFGTEIYELTTARLAEGRRAAHAAVAEADRGVELAVARLREAVGADDDPVVGAALEAALAGQAAPVGAGAGGDSGDSGAQPAEGAEGLPATVDGVLAALVRDSDAAAERRGAARRVHDDARRRLDEQRRLRASLDLRADLQARSARLTEAAVAVDEARSRLEAAGRADTVTGAARGLRAAQAVLAEAGTTLVDAREAATDADPELESVPGLVLVTGAWSSAERADSTDGTAGFDSFDSHGGEAPTLPEVAAAVAAHRDDLRSDLAVLGRVAAVERGLPGRRAELLDAGRALEQVDVDLAALDAELVEGPVERTALVTARDAARRSADDEPAVARRVADARAQLAAVLATDALREEATRLDELLADRSTEALVELDLEAGLRRRQITGTAGQLALSLEAGKPCPVCGSIEHPAPAAPTDDHPTDDDVEAAALSARAAGQRQRDAAAAAAAARARLDVAVAGLGDLDEAGAREAVTEAEQALDRARAAVASARAAERALDDHDREADALRTRAETTRTLRATRAERLEGDRRRLADDEALVAEAVAGAEGSADGRADGDAERAPGTVADRVGLLTRRADLADRLVSALRAAEVARVAHDQRRVELADALAASGFATADAAAAAVLPGPERDSLGRRVAGHDTELAVVGAGLADPAIAALTGEEEVGVPAAEGALGVAEVDLAATTDAAGRSADRARRATEALAALRRAEAAGESVAEEARAVVRMADLTGATGTVNVRGVTLGTYVLLRRFDDVVAAANARLRVMSSGRYVLEASEEREQGSRSRRTGLALAIRDASTDTTRDPASFSGGETFYASLSLALGLADVVQAEAGGLELGTLFVDEGFGSLDPETLDAVMTELGRLSDSGRVIGIVSHVDELKQRIADRIEVRRLPDGSSTLRSTVG